MRRGAYGKRFMHLLFGYGYWATDCRYRTSSVRLWKGSIWSVFFGHCFARRVFLSTFLFSSVACINHDAEQFSLIGHGLFVQRVVYMEAPRPPRRRSAHGGKHKLHDACDSSTQKSHIKSSNTQINTEPDKQQQQHHKRLHCQINGQSFAMHSTFDKLFDRI